MKVLIISPTIFSGGAQKLILQLHHNLRKIGCDAIIATSVFDKSNIPEKLLEDLNIKVIQPNMFKKGGDNTSYIHNNNIFIFFVRLIRCWFSIKKIIKENNIDLINPHDPPSHWLAAFQGKPCVWTCNEPISLWAYNDNYLPLTFKRPNIFQKIIQFIYLMIDKMIVKINFDKIIVLSPEGEKRVKNAYNKKSEIVYPGVDYTYFDKNYNKEELKNKWNLSGSYIIGQVASITTEKNHEMIIKIISRLVGKIPTLKYIIIGDGPTKKHLERIVTENNLEDRVIFTGRVSEEELVELFHLIDLLLDPTLTSTWGLTQFEALVCNTPCIASAVSGSSTILNKYSIGLVALPKQEDFKNMINYAFNNQEDLGKLVRRGKLFVKNNLTWTHYGKKVHHILNTQVK